MLLSLVISCLAVAVQPCMQWIPVKKTCLIKKFEGKKSPNTPNYEQGHFERNLSLPFHVFHSMSSYPYVKTIWRWSYSCYRVFELFQLHLSVLISIDLPILIFPTFRAFNYFFITVSMNYFGQIVLDILENN